MDEVLNYFKLVYSPKSPATEEIVKIFSEMFKTIEGLEDSEALETFFKSEEVFSAFAAIQFDDSFKSRTDVSNIKNFEVSIRFPSDLRRTYNRTNPTSVETNWATNLVFPNIEPQGPRLFEITTGGTPNYHDEGFLAIQHFLAIALISAKEKTDPKELLSKNKFPLISMRRYPHPDWIQDDLGHGLSFFIILVLVMCFGQPLTNMIKYITLEKEKQLKESMKIMGLPNWLHWAAWYVKYFIFLLLISIFVILLLAIRFSDTSIFQNSNIIVLLLLCIFVISSCITFCFAISVMFNKANTASVLGSLILFFSFVPFLIIKTESVLSKLLISLLPLSAFGFAIEIVLFYEGIGQGIQWATVFQPYRPSESISLGLIMVMLTVDTVLYMLIAIYVEAVFPGEYGVPKPWYFLCTCSYWHLHKHVSLVGNRANTGEFFESEPQNLAVGIQITNLRKVFRKKAAVEDLSLNMYENQITVLLGHNGAGKTTTMSMLSGMITPTSGTAKVNGFDIRTEIDGVRQSLGLCPQHNVIFDELTVEEHLYFFSKLKGLSKDEINAEINKYVSRLELEPKRKARVSSLSGGMKRKLCIAIALCGYSKVLMLDEPTAGMDPSARRAVWNLLLSEKEGRTMLLTTHFMDEADLLGDRIAIMAAGKLQCCGSSFFLKKKFGAGYSLIIDKSRDCDPAQVTALLGKYVPNIEVRSNAGSELSYILEQNYSSQFESMLKDLENNSKRLGILGYGISLTTMEDVFMKVISAHFLRVKGHFHYAQTFQAMFMKKYLTTCRSWRLFLTQIVIAIVFVVLPAMNVGKEDDGSLSPAHLDLRAFRNPVVLVEDLSNSIYLETYLDYLKRNSYSYKNTEKLSGKILDLIKNSPLEVWANYIVSATFDKEGNKDHITAWFNDAYHSAGISLALVLNAAFKKALDCKECSIQFINHPIPYDLDKKVLQLTGEDKTGVLSNQASSLAFISAIYVIFIIRERVSKFKHQQMISGANVLVFWSATLIWDFLTFVLICLVILATIACFQVEGLKTPSQLDVDNSFFMWKSPGIGRNICYLCIVGLTFFLIIIMIESKLFLMLFYCIKGNKRRPLQGVTFKKEDNDVAEERSKIKNASREELLSYTLILRDLTKVYKKLLAVNSLCLGVRNNECFGLLGVNGAGKTTTFMMMTGDTRITYGDGFVNGYSIKRQLKNAQKCTGYCPQFSALLDDLTAQETIVILALLRGIKYSACRPLADTLAREFDFTPHLKKQVKKLSGGNKKKLSTAVAVIGSPTVLYFDEPTTGLDPVTRRNLWNALCKVRDSGKCLVLTSHSMEECEALCTRLAIMVNGQFKCLGSSQHLKNKFAKGYQLIIKLKKSAEALFFVDSRSIEMFVKSQFPTAVLKEKHEEMLFYYIKDLSIPLSQMFGILESAKKGDYNLEDYSLGQSSLEQVFLTFTKQQVQ
ncbi:ATP-binding cassette sub-family A member 3-like [Anoplophora glabripennis]|uniref:ATP-binding cassette sub-family A member 3-like n=1 Tax=Anoplophora glabripennis TaxID=217634 RepID=UPI000C76AC87|nr:ATP-binding cassette sub-family A member 3-like [Anoplophora glabripennis]